MNFEDNSKVENMTFMENVAMAFTSYLTSHIYSTDLLHSSLNSIANGGK